MRFYLGINRNLVTTRTTAKKAEDGGPDRRKLQGSSRYAGQYPKSYKCVVREGTEETSHVRNTVKKKQKELSATKHGCGEWSDVSSDTWEGSRHRKATVAHFPEMKAFESK